MIASHSSRSSKRKQIKRPYQRRKEEEGSPLFSKKALKSILITLGVGGALLLIASLCIYFLPNPSPFIRPAGVAIAAMTATIGGYVSGRIHRNAPAVCGLLNGALLTAIMLVLSLLSRSHAYGYSLWLSLLLHSLIPLCSVAGAYFGARRPPAPKRRKRKH